MGRPYKNELDAIKETYEYIDALDVSSIYSFFKSNCDCPLLIIGSGGSYAVAKEFELCYQKLGGFAKAITPYQLKDEKYMLGNSKILIVTAGGNNPDTVGVYNYVRLYEPMEICVICMSKGSKIAKAVKCNGDAVLFETNIPFGKDGYLAVNSSVAMFTIAKKIMNLIEHNSKLSLNICDLSSEKIYIQQALTKCTNLIVLYGGWGTPAAYDFESKCAEAGLISVQFVDYRNFAHGRHNWIDKNMDSTMIVALTTPSDEVIRDKTLNKLPSNIPQIHLKTQKEGSLASLELLIQIFYFVNFLGEIRGIDPGRPHVPDFGSKLYHIKHNLKSSDSYLKSITRSTKESCIYRKMKRMQLDKEWYDYYSVMYDKFIDKLCRVKYDTILLDFDGTIIGLNQKEIPQFVVDILNQLLENNILVGFATGRGDSIIKHLKDAIKEVYWDKVIVGFYNGTYISYLSEISSLNCETPITLAEFYEYISSVPMLKEKVLNKGYQLSIRECETYKIELYFELLNEIKLNNNFVNIQILKSGHAIDIIESNYGKKKVIDFIKAKRDSQILCIGDGGKIFQNDFEMLSSNCGLSSNHQNWLGESGWNLAPLGVRGINATRFYFERIKIEKDCFSIKGL